MDRVRDDGTPVRFPAPIRSLLKAGEYGLTVGAACYVAGFLVHGFYLGEHAVVRFDILRTKYILSGALFLGFVGVFVFALVRAWTILERPGEGRRTIGVARALVAEALAMALVLYGFYLAISNIPGSEEWWLTTEVSGQTLRVTDTSAFFGRPIVLYLFVALAPYVVVLACFLLLIRTKKVGAFDLDRLKTAVGRRLGIVTAVALLATFLLAIVYADVVYGDIPQQIGGGRTIPVSDVVIDDERVETALRSGRYPVVHILDRTPDSIIILLFTVQGDKKAIEVARDRVASIAYGAYGIGFAAVAADAAPAVCDGDALSLDTLQALVGDPPAMPPGLLPDLPRLAPPADDPHPATLPVGPPADPATVEAIALTMREAAACLNAGDMLRVLALLTDELLAATIAAGLVPPELVPSLDAPPVAVPPDKQRVIGSILGTWVLADGRVAALIRNYDPVEPPFAVGDDLVVFARDGEGWLIDSWIQHVVTSEPGTEVAAP